MVLIGLHILRQLESRKELPAAALNVMLAIERHFWHISQQSSSIQHSSVEILFVVIEIPSS